MENPTPSAAVEFIGPNVQETDYCAAGAVGKYVYGLPTNAAYAVRIDSNTGKVAYVGPQLAGGNLNYVGAVVADNYVFGLPYNAPRIMRIHGSSGNIDFIGPAIEGREKYHCACTLGNCIYAIPLNAQRVMRIDCETHDVSFVGPKLGRGGNKYRAAAAVGDCIYGIPLWASRVLRVRLLGDVEEVELIGPDFGETTGPGKYFCAAAVGEHVYAPPCNADRTLRITHRTGDCRLVGPDLRGLPRYLSAAVVGSRVYGVPEGITGKNMLRIEEKTGNIDFVGPACEQPGGFCESVVVGKHVYALPTNYSKVVRIDGVSGRVDRIGLGSIECGFNCAAVLHGKIYAFPWDSGQILRLTPPFDWQRAVNRWGLEIANVLAGTVSIIPNGFIPQYEAAECLDHTIFEGQRKVVKLAREAAAVWPVEERGDVMVIHAYTLDSNLCPQVTAAIRQMDAERLTNWVEYIYHLERALLKQPCFRGTVFRGVDLRVPRQIYEPGTKITWQSFSAATCCPFVLVRHSFVKIINGDELSGTIFVISACKARCVERLSKYPEEEEVVFVTNSHFKVEALVTEDSGKRALLPELKAYDLRRLRVFCLEEL